MAIVSPSPINLTYAYDTNVIAGNNTFYSTEGIFFTLNDLLSGARDFATNQDNLLILTDNFSLKDKIQNFNEIDKLDLITKTTISFLSGNTTLYLSAGAENQDVGFTSQLSSATIFNLDHNDYGTTFLVDDTQLCITLFTTNQLNLQNYPRGDANNTQRFNLALFNDKAAIFTNTTSEVFTVNVSSNTLETSSFVNANFTSNQIFYLNRFYYNSIADKGESNLAKYTATPNSINIVSATNSLPYNYLISTPYTTLDATEDHANINIAPLKNYYSPNGLQTPLLSAQLKQYNKIYTGLNTEEGYDKVYLSYKGSEIAKTFYKDVDNYFHFPVSGTNIALSASSLVKAGALGGSSPIRSDRIFVKKANYRNYSNWGNFSGVQNGVYFCSWLSAGANGTEAVWMDRYFEPSHTNLTGVLTADGFLGIENNYPNLIWDTPSTQIFNPECLYVYHRIGDNDNQAVVDNLSATLTRYYKDWTNPLYNAVTNLSAGILVNYAASAVEVWPGTKEQSLDTSISYGVADFSSQELDSNGITLAFYAYNNDWSDIRGSQLVGNYYYGGIGFTKNNTLLTPFATIAGNDLTTINTKLTTLKETPASTTLKTFLLKGEYDESYYIVTQDKKLYVYDQDDLVVSTYSLPVSGNVIGAHLIKQNNNKQILVFTNPATNTIQWKKFNVNGTLSNSAPNTGTNVGNTSYVIDLSGVPTYYNNSIINGTVNSENEVYYFEGDVLKRLVKPSTTYSLLSALSAEGVACDHEDKLWVLYANRNLCKLDRYGKVIWDVYLTDAPVASAISSVVGSYTRTVNFISEINPDTGNLEHSGLVIDPKTQKLFKVNPINGDIIKTANIGNNTSYNITLGDTTGYDYQRKYIYTLENSNDLSIKAFLTNTAILDETGVVVNLNYDIGNLTPGWHHFAATLNANNLLQFYIDGVVATSTTVGAVSSLYRVTNNKNNPDLLIGTASFKKETLASYTGEKLSADPYRFNGRVADVRFYTQALLAPDIRALQKRFIQESFNDLIWSVPSGERYYIEQIERFFLHRLPGAKSNMFNIKIKNSNITNLDLRKIIEKNIIASLNKIIPVHTKLNTIIWE